MKILKRGKPPGEQLLRATCKFCKSELEFSKKEAVSECDRDGMMWKVDCPVCDEIVWAYPDNVVNDDQN